jgi:hypothetical protein
MINKSFNNADVKTRPEFAQPNNIYRIETEFSRFIQAHPLRQEIFNAIERLEISKIRLIDNEFKNILNRWQSL